MSKITEDSARGGFFLFSGTTLSSAILAISVVLLGRFLGPELYGQYSLVIVIVPLLLLFTDLGITTGITKFVSSLRAEGKDAHAARIINHGLLFRVAIGLVFSALCIAFPDFFALLINRPDLAFYVQISALSLIFQAIYTTLNGAFIGLDKSEYNALTSNTQAIVRTVSQLSLVVLGFGIMGALIGYIAGFAIAAVCGFALLIFKFFRSSSVSGKFVSQSYSDSLKILGRYCMPVYVSVVLVGFFPLYQQLVLAFFSTDAAIGNFRAAYNFATLLTIILTAISTALLPAFSKLEHSPELIDKFFNRANKYTTLIIVPLTTLVIIFSEPIVQFLYGAEYTTAPLFLSLSCSLYFLVGIGYLTLTTGVFNGLGKTRLTMNMTLINFVLLITLSPIFAMFYDVVGVIVAYLIAGAVATLYAAIVAKKQLNIGFNLKSILRIYLVSAISAVPSLMLLFFTSLSSFVVLVIGGIAYLAAFLTLMPLMRVVNKFDLQELDRITSRIPLLKYIAKPLFAYQKRLLRLINAS
ncbi:MAG: flippase [Candidatus Bathyarchaeota archaeon]|nr:flippase [Candidatus Bathyarchaeota archaeon]